MTDIHTTLADGERQAAEVQKPRTDRITLADLHARVVDTAYMRPLFDETVIICAVQLDNGFVLVGVSAPMDRANFDEDFGQQLAFDDAIRQAYPLVVFAALDQKLRG